jgi:beta-barrel assembly-enhancing protease
LPDFSNPRLPQEDVNVSADKPLRNFFALALGALAAGALCVGLLAYLGGTFAHLLPYSVEESLIEPYARQRPQRGGTVESYLQGVADRMVADAKLPLPEGMRVRVHYVDEPAINAFATLGGHMAVYRGLLERVSDENMLAMVMAHEIGHLRLRHPIRSLGRGVAFAAALSVVSAGAGSRVADNVLGQSGMLTLMTFSRTQEEEADADALAALAAVYGHAGGAQQTFAMLQAANARGLPEPPKILSTHPLTQDRIDRLAGLIAQRGLKADGPRTPIPEAVRAALEKADRKARPRPSPAG